MITQEYYLDMVPDKVKPLVIVSQYDTDRQIIFHLLTDGEPYTPGSASLKIGDNSYSLMIDGSNVYFTVPTTITETAQHLLGEVVCDNVGSLNFDLVVDETPSNSTRMLANQALSIIMGKRMDVYNPEEVIDYLRGGE